MPVFLFFAAVLGGALNSVAGGGSFVALPALIYAGITPVVANATTTLALWPGTVSSAIAYQRDIRTDRRSLAILGGTSLVGGLLGALLLVRTSDTSFMRLLPWLMFLASITFTFGGRLTARLSGGSHVDGRHHFAVWSVALLFLIAIYGGYFGGGMGIMMLATLSVVGMSDIHEMNGLKSLLGASINGVALAEFVRSHAVSWAPGLLMMAGSMAGGYFGATLARRIDRVRVRVFVIVVGWAMTGYFFLR